jgi:hypothetical protein
MLGLIGLFFITVIIVRSVCARSLSRWRRYIMSHIERRRDWFSVQQVISDTSAPCDVVVDTILALAKSGVINCQPGEPVLVVRDVRGEILEQRMLEISDDPALWLGPSRLIRCSASEELVGELVFQFDTRTVDHEKENAPY